MTGGNVPGAQSQTYRYRAVDERGVPVRGTIQGADPAAAADRLRAMGLFPIRFSAAVTAARSKTLATRDVAAGLRMLSALFEAGLPMSRALDAFEGIAPTAWRASIAPVRERIRGGEMLASALAQELRLPAVLIGVIAAGEAVGALAQAVERAAALGEDDAELRSSIRGALVYPAILLVAGAASIGLLVTVVLPRFATILGDLGQRPPAMTRLVLSFTDALHASWGGLLLGGILTAILVHLLATTPQGAQTWSGIMLRLPGVGPIRHASASSRACLTLAALLESGVPVAQALTHSANAAGDAAVAARLRAAQQSVIEGGRLGASLLATGALTVPALQMLMAGEESGRLAMMCAHAGRLESRRARERTRAAVRLLEPGLILVFGAMVAAVAAALLQAVYTVRPVGA